MFTLKAHATPATILTTPLVRVKFSAPTEGRFSQFLRALLVALGTMHT
jgi:hypothetical protein